MLHQQTGTATRGGLSFPTRGDSVYCMPATLLVHRGRAPIRIRYQLNAPKHDKPVFYSPISHITSVMQKHYRRYRSPYPSRLVSLILTGSKLIRQVLSGRPAGIIAGLSNLWGSAHTPDSESSYPCAVDPGNVLLTCEVHGAVIICHLGAFRLALESIRIDRQARLTTVLCADVMRREVSFGLCAQYRLAYVFTFNATGYLPFRSLDWQEFNLGTIASQ